MSSINENNIGKKNPKTPLPNVSTDGSLYRWDSRAQFIHSQKVKFIDKKEANVMQAATEWGEPQSEIYPTENDNVYSIINMRA